MKRMLLALIVIFSPIHADEWIQMALQNVDTKAEEWFKEHLKENLRAIKPETNVLNSMAHGKIGKKCSSSSTIDPDVQHGVSIFMSFSLSDATWIALSRELESVGGAFILCGLPENSFAYLSKRLKHLSEKGVRAPVILNPQEFSKYGIEKCPAFIVKDEKGFDILYGNISLLAALQLIAERGETKISSELMAKLKEVIHE